MRKTILSIQTHLIRRHCERPQGAKQSKNEIASSRRCVGTRNDNVKVITAFVLFLYILSISLVFLSPESLAWWQKPVPEPVPELAEEKFARTINQSLQEQAEELSGQVKTLDEKNKSMRTELNQVGADRQDLLKKLKDYTVHREALNARILTLENGIVNLNEINKGLSGANKSLSEQAAVLQKELELSRAAEIKVREQKPVIPVIADNKDIVEPSRDKQADKLNTAVRKLKEDNALLKRDLKNASNEVSSLNASLGMLKRESAIAHYNLGVMFYQSGDFNQSLLEYQKVLEVLPGDARAHYGLALIYDKHKKNKEKAIYHYKRYLDIEPDAEDAAEVKERITETGLEEKIWTKK